jgi:3-oxoacyl-[acyl-carrier protein] reductase
MRQSLSNLELNSLTLPQCALVTGAQGGIGKAIVKSLSSYGVKIIALDMKLNDLEIDENQAVEQIQCDITEIKQINQVWSRLLEEGTQVDCLINNAGIYPAVGWDDYTLELAHKVINTNLIGVFMMSQSFARQTSQGGIINVSSVSAFLGSSDPLYGASKAGLIGLTKSMALTLSPRIRVNAIAPSVVNTSMMDAIPPEVLKRYRQRELLSSGIEPEAIANAVVYLASSLSQNVTGSTIDVNNGIYLR